MQMLEKLYASSWDSTHLFEDPFSVSHFSLLTLKDKKSVPPWDKGTAEMRVLLCI
jgi:hypothetical protein